MKAYTSAEAGIQIGVSKTTVNRLIADGALVASNIARKGKARWRIEEQAIKDYLKARQTKIPKRGRAA